MNKIVAILMCIFGIQTMSAQTTLSSSLLKSNKWLFVENGSEDSLTVSFDNEKMYTSEHLHFVHPVSGEVKDKIKKVDFTYYLSDTITDNYDATKVGKATSGKYLTLHNITSKYLDSSGDYTIFEVTPKNNSEITLTLCGFPPNYINKKGRKFSLIKKQ